MFISKDKETSRLQASATQKIELYIAFSTFSLKIKVKLVTLTNMKTIHASKTAIIYQRVTETLY